MKALFGTAGYGEGGAACWSPCHPLCSAPGLSPGPGCSSGLGYTGPAAVPTVRSVDISFPVWTLGTQWSDTSLLRVSLPSMHCGSAGKGAPVLTRPVSLSPEPAGHAAALGDREPEAGRGQHCPGQLGGLLLPPLSCHGRIPPPVPLPTLCLPRGSRNEPVRPSCASRLLPRAAWAPGCRCWLCPTRASSSCVWSRAATRRVGSCRSCAPTGEQQARGRVDAGCGWGLGWQDLGHGLTPALPPHTDLLNGQQLSTVSSLCSQASHLWIQPTVDGKYSEKKKFQKVPKSKTNFSLTGNYSHNIYLAFITIYTAFTLNSLIVQLVKNPPAIQETLV